MALILPSSLGLRCQHHLKPSECVCVSVCLCVCHIQPKLRYRPLRRPRHLCWPSVRMRPNFALCKVWSLGGCPHLRASAAGKSPGFILNLLGKATCFSKIPSETALCELEKRCKQMSRAPQHEQATTHARMRRRCGHLWNHSLPETPVQNHAKQCKATATVACSSLGNH